MDQLSILARAKMIALIALVITPLKPRTKRRPIRFSRHHTAEFKSAKAD
jgi:hypothetical protein